MTLSFIYWNILPFNVIYFFYERIPFLSHWTSSLNFYFQFFNSTQLNMYQNTLTTKLQDEIRNNRKHRVFHCLNLLFNGIREDMVCQKSVRFWDYFYEISVLRFEILKIYLSITTFTSILSSSHLYTEEH